MHIIENKSYESKEKKEFDFISCNSKGTLSIVMKDGTHYNFIEEERDKIIEFINELGKNNKRNEAINWIKKLRNHKFYCVVCEKFDCDCSSSDCFKPRSEGVENWIKHFFNITERDLGFK